MEKLLDLILSDVNLIKAAQKVSDNDGAPGIDGMSPLDGRRYLTKHRDELVETIKRREYKPKPVKRVEIPKPDGGVRLLGIPTVIDRTIQQAIHQVLSPIFEKQFHENSFGFRPNRDCHKAIKKSLEYLNEGYNVIVDIDLEKFFDKVNHDKLMQILSLTIKDNDLMSLIRKYLVSGVMIEGVVMDTDEGTPQGGPMSPLLSNIMLNELDKELTKRGLRFVRYADDCNIYVKSIRAGERVMASITEFIEKKLKLKVNKSKSKVDYCYNGIKFLGFGFYYCPSEERSQMYCASEIAIETQEEIKKINI
jgi:RNA-directed DNA polymerase